MTIQRVAKAALYRVAGERGFERLRALHMARKIATGRYRDPEVDLIEHAVAAGDRAIDLGANFGLYSFHLGRAVGPAGSVIAFEPVPSTAFALRLVLRMLRVADRVTVVEKAAGDHQGRVAFSVPRRADRSADAGLSGAAPEGDPGDAELPMARVDDEVGPGRPVSFIKIDVEGAELAALRGAERLLSSDRPTIVLEISPVTLARHSVQPADIGEFLRSLGYQLYVYEAPARRLAPAKAAEIAGNAVAVHPRRAPLLSRLLRDGGGD